VSGCIIRYFGLAVNESGEIYAYELTSDKFVPSSWRISHLNDVVSDSDVLVKVQRGCMVGEILSLRIQGRCMGQG